MLTITISTRAAIIAAVTLLLGFAAVPFAITRAQDGDGQSDVVSRVPVETAFSYQGRLEINGVPANGAHILEFTLYDNSVGGAQIGPTNTGFPQVTNGTFTIPLDFEEGAFNGDARWLEIKANVNGNWVLMPPRQQLRATPYALHSLTTGPHSHFGETWTGAGDLGLKIENTSEFGGAIYGVGFRAVTGASNGGIGVQASSLGVSGVGVDSLASGTNSIGVRTQAVGDGSIGISASGHEWAGVFTGWVRVTQVLRADDVLPTYPGACSGGGCYVGDTVKPWTAMFAGAFNVQSDARKKQDITGLPYGLTEILALRPVSYSFIDDETGKTRLGLIAQEVEQVMPEVVTPPASEDAFYAMSYDDLIPVLINAIKEQQAEIEVLKAALGIE